MSSERFHFGQFVLDMGRYELTRAGESLHLERIPMSLLVLLVRQSGRLIEREEIIEQLWGNGLHFDTDNSINTAIRKIRHTLGDDPANPQYVETVLGKGYRFKCHTLVSAQRVEQAEREVTQSRIMLAVLPFENLSGDPAQEYFSDGLTEETIMRLGQMSPTRMGVIARTSSMAYKQTNKSVAQIGQELGVNYGERSTRRRPHSHYGAANPSAGPDTFVGGKLRPSAAGLAGYSWRNRRRSCSSGEVEIDGPRGKTAYQEQLSRPASTRLLSAGALSPREIQPIRCQKGC